MELASIELAELQINLYPPAEWTRSMSIRHSRVPAEHSLSVLMVTRAFEHSKSSKINITKCWERRKTGLRLRNLKWNSTTATRSMLDFEARIIRWMLMPARPESLKHKYRVFFSPFNVVWLFFFSWVSRAKPNELLGRRQAAKRKASRAKSQFWCSVRFSNRKRQHRARFLIVEKSFVLIVN